MNDNKSVLSSPSTPETERVPKEGRMPRVTDTLITDDATSDPVFHTEALANAVVDNEAGTKPDEELGGIVPLEHKR